jgi:hypothetical protein
MVKPVWPGANVTVNVPATFAARVAGSFDASSENALLLKTPLLIETAGVDNGEEVSLVNVKVIEAVLLVEMLPKSRRDAALGCRVVLP